MAIKVGTVGELIAALGKFDPAARVEISYESTNNDVAVYREKNGNCILDGDDCFYERMSSDGSPEFGPAPEHSI